MISQHTYTATVDVAGIPTDLVLVGGSVTLDEGWSPFVQADLTVAADSAAYAALDPREDARVQLTLTQVPGTTITVDLGVRTRTRTPEGDVQLKLAGDEALAQDLAHLQDFPYSVVTANVDGLVNAYLSLIPAALTPPYPTVVLDNPSQYLYPGEFIWDALTPVLEQAGLRLYVNTERQWKLTATPLNTSEVVSLGSETLLQEATDVVSRDEDWADSVVVKYAWTDAGGTAQTAVDIAWAGTPSKTKVIEHAFTYPGAGAAQHILNRAQARGRTIDSVAVSNYAVRPGMQLTLTIAGSLLVGRVAAVSWSLDDDRMTITPRDLELAHEFAWALLEVGDTWADSAPGIPWTTP